MKKILKSLLLRLVAFVRPDESGKVIFYHDVGKKYTKMGTPVELFKAHVFAALANGYRYVEKIGELQGVSGNKALLLCFDDGFRGIWDEREYFKSEGLHPTVFIAIDLVGKPGYLTWKEILELQSQYGFVFQSHTWSHQTLSGAYIDESPKADRTDDWFKHELVDSRIALSERLGNDVNEICFPAGYFSDEIIDRCKEAGYVRAFASYPDKGCDGFVVPRHLVQSVGEMEFLSVLRGALIPLKQRYLRQHKG